MRKEFILSSLATMGQVGEAAVELLHKTSHDLSVNTLRMNAAIASRDRAEQTVREQQRVMERLRKELDAARAELRSTGLRKNP